MDCRDSPTASSAPLKKRAKVIAHTDCDVLPHGEDEQAAAAALSSMYNISDDSKSDSHDGKSMTNSEDSSDSDTVSSKGSARIPKVVHKPPVISTMVDHTYTDYSVVGEEALSFLNQDEDHPIQPDISDEERRAKEKAIKKIKKIFGNFSPQRKNSGGVVKPFPEKLMEVLDRGDMDEIITWLPHGRAFIVMHAQQLKEIVLPRFFKQSKFMSFTRQLNLWGFKRITKGTDAGAYYHELFLRGRPLLSMLMRRQKVKGTGIKLTPSPNSEPNFYAISEKNPLPVIPKSKKLDPLPPISSEIASTRSAKPVSTKSSFQKIPIGMYNGSAIGSNADFYLQQQQRQLERQGVSHPSHMMHGGHGRISFQQESYPMSMLPREPQRQVQRLSAPTTQTDLNMAHNSLAQQAMSTAEHVLHQANAHHPHPLYYSHGSNPVNINPVEDLKQKLLSAVQSLENAQSLQTAMKKPSFPPSVLGCVNEQSVRQYGMSFPPPLNPYYSMGPPQQHLGLIGQNRPMNEHNISALMSALDQTRQVAAAAQAQSNLLQQVANDLAFHQQNKRK